MADFSGAAGQNLAEDTLWDAAGDVAYGTGSDTGAVLAIGSACQVLVVACCLPSWGTAPQSTGAFDNGTNNITSGGTWSIDVDATGTDGSDLYAAGTLRFGCSQDLRIYHGGTHNYITGVSGDLVLTTDGDGNGIILDAEDDTVEIKYSGTVGATFGTGGLDLASGDAYSINCTSVLNATTLGSAVVTSSLTTVGALDSGSITSGFTSIDVGAGAICTTGAITGGSLAVDNFTLNGTELDLSSGDFTLDVAGDVAINADGGDITFADASLSLAGIHNSSCVGELRLHEAANYIGLKPPALSANQIWTWPATKGSCGEVLTCDGCGVLSWAAGGGCARSVSGDTDNGVITWVTSGNTFAAEAGLLYDATTLTVTKDTDGEIVALKLINQSDSANTAGFISLEFDLEDTGGNAVDSGKIAVKKEASFTDTAATQDSSMEFHTSLNGTLAEKMTINSAGNVCIGGDLTVTGGCITLAGSLIFSGGDTTSLNLIDAIDATTEATIETAIDTLSNLTTTGALNAGSITCGFGTIDTGASTITTTGLISGGSLDIDNVLINGTTIGHTCTTDLMTVGCALLTLAGDINLGGNNIDCGGVIFLKEQADADSDVAGSGQLWVDTATPNALYFTDDAGTDFNLSLRATTAISGPVELATACETTTGTSAVLALTPDGLAGSVVFGTRYVQMVLADFATDIEEGNGKFYLHIPAGLNGMDLVEVHAKVITVGSGSTVDVQVHNLTDGSDMLSTSLTIDDGELDSKDAGTAAVINGSEDDVVTNDVIRIDVDGNGGDSTVAKGLIVTLGFRLP